MSEDLKDKVPKEWEVARAQMQLPFYTRYKTEHVIEAIGEKMPKGLEACHKIIAILIVHLLEVWQQYNTMCKASDEDSVGHGFMSSGEDAATTLEELGILEDMGYEAKIKEPFLTAYKEGLWE